MLYIYCFPPIFCKEAHCVVRIETHRSPIYVKYIECLVENVCNTCYFHIILNVILNRTLRTPVLPFQCQQTILQHDNITTIT